MDYQKILDAKNSKMRLATDQVDKREIAVLLRELEAVLKNNVQGDVVELGCYEGGSAVAMQQLLKKHNYPKQLWLYDSFEGLPDKTSEDMSAAGTAFKAGELKASRAELLRNFTKFDLKHPEVKRAWFYELDHTDLPDQIALAFLDGDFYESIMDSLKLIWPKLTEKSVVLIDDYHSLTLPGVKKAVDAWARDHAFTLKIESTLAIITHSN
jgi:O-methyltransferase